MKFTFLMWLVAIMPFIVSCKKEKLSAKNNNETEGLGLVKTFTGNDHTLNLFTRTGDLRTGYNELFFQIKNEQGELIKNVSANWKPVMNMGSMSHSCPTSEIKLKEGTQSLLSGYMIFQMAGNDVEYWELTINYTVNGQNYSLKDKIEVKNTARQVVTSFVGMDNKQYVLALVAPTVPKVAINDITIALFTMINMDEFEPANNYRIELDPRMPGMGNHTSPNNVSLLQSNDKFYHGKLSLTMTGYWKINLKLNSQNDQLIKGEHITEENESSSLFLEIEF